MIARLRHGLIVWTLGAAVLFATLRPADAYPVDCAILLCLAGGWPSNPHCDAARAEFVRRVTPWPVEPPLQIWRCPMGGRGGGLPPAALLPSTAGASADVDISSPDFDPVRSIRVYHIQYRQRTTGGGESEGEECVRRDNSRIGTYGVQGDFRWEKTIAQAVLSGPDYSAFDPHENCRWYSYRSVAVSWTDALGNRSFEEVRY